MEKLYTDLGSINYYYRQAKPEFPTIIFFPSAGGDSAFYNFKNIIDKLDDGYGILAIDTIGYGLSTDTFMERTVDNVLQNYSDILHHEKPKNIILFGHSLGSIYALLLEKNFDINIEKIILLEPPHTGIAEELVEETQAQIKQFEEINKLKEKNKITYKSFISVINPNNSAEEKELNAKMMYDTFGNQSLISESENFPALMTQMEIIEHSQTSVELHVIVTDARKEEYENSNYNDMGTLYSINGEHFLHWTNEEVILELLDTIIN